MSRRKRPACREGIGKAEVSRALGFHQLCPLIGGGLLEHLAHAVLEDPLSCGPHLTLTGNHVRILVHTLSFSLTCKN